MKPNSVFDVAFGTYSLAQETGCKIGYVNTFTSPLMVNVELIKIQLQAKHNLFLCRKGILYFGYPSEGLKSPGISFFFFFEVLSFSLHLSASRFPPERVSSWITKVTQFKRLHRSLLFGTMSSYYISSQN